ncbi:MAG: ribosome maturation factor RimM [Prevotella sp.]|nr:ribosome maturation factor RimM [Prevotella sp.]
MIKQEDVFKIGRIGKPHGVKGELSFSFTDDVFDRTDSEYLVLLVNGILVPFFWEEYRFKSNETALIKFVDIDTKEQAQELTGCDVYFPWSLSDGIENEMSLHSTVGFSLFNAGNNTRVGTVKSIDDSTANILFNVETSEENIVMIPASEELIVSIDVEKREIVVDIPEGLLEINN